jgi:endonuclease YncB( thermonuclease family)
MTGSRGEFKIKQNPMPKTIRFRSKNKLLNLIAAIFLAVFSAVAYNITQEPSTPNAPTQNIDAKLEHSFSGKISVIDGDSIRVGENEVRLMGIDAPEYKQTCFDAKNIEYSCGKISREFLLNFANQKDGVCHYHQKDKYNRFLAKCYIGEVVINEEIVKNGMAVIYNFGNGDPKLDELELQAKNNHLGIWRGAFQLPKDYRKSHKKS